MEIQYNSDISDSVISDNRTYRIKFLVPIVQNNKNFLKYIGFRIYQIHFAVRRDPKYPSSTDCGGINLSEKQRKNMNLPCRKVPTSKFFFRRKEGFVPEMAFLVEIVMEFLTPTFKKISKIHKMKDFVYIYFETFGMVPNVLGKEHMSNGR